jgi:hypothetical protein
MKYRLKNPSGVLYVFDTSLRRPVCCEGAAAAAAAAAATDLVLASVTSIGSASSACSSTGAATGSGEGLGDMLISAKQ